MTAYLAVALAAFLAAGMTLYSRFGLGTLLLPVFALFFPAEMAVVATAMVHGANNVFKVSLLGRHADREVVLKFGLPAIDHVGIGSDFDSVGDSLPIGLKDVSEYPNLVAEFLRRGYSESDIAKILGGNLLRVWSEVEAFARKSQAPQIKRATAH